MTREQLMSKPATLSKLMVIGLLGALSLLLLEIRFEHREALGEAWQSWIPLLYCGAMLALGAAALTRWHRGGRQVLLVGVSAICDSEGDWQSSASSAPGLEPRIFRGPDARAGRRYPQSSSWNHEDLLLAGRHMDVLAGSSPFAVLPVIASAAYLLLAKRYWFAVPFRGIAIATGCFATGAGLVLLR